MDATQLCFVSAYEQRRMIEGAEISALELVDAHIQRIERYNPTLNAFVTLRLDEAREEARAADSDIAADRADRAVGVLHGLPIGVKDCFQTKGLRATMGCLALADYVAGF